MGNVLENGLYLPDEGERNAYDGLKGNWNTLDNLVETVTALSSTGLIRKPVDALPITDIQTNVIYMLKATKPNGDVYRIEYMYIDDHWDPVGTSETTLDDYYTKTETDNLPAVKSGVNATKVSNYDTHIADTDIHVTLANKQTWDGKQNALDTAQTAAVNSGVTGTKVTGYDNHVSDTDIHVTAADKTAWNGKQDGLSQTQLAAVNSGVTDTKVTGYDSHIADTDIHVTTADKATWSGKQDALTQTQLDNIATIPDRAYSADLATVATSGSYTDLINAPTIPTVNNATLTIQKNGTDVATFTANASSNVTANLSIPVNTSDLNNDAGFLTQHNPIDNELSATSENALQNKVVKSELDGKAPLVHTHAASDITSGTFNIARIPNLDASKITSGTIDIARLPKGSLERLIKVANQAARYALTADDVQLGDTVQQLDTGVMYVVTDETKLDSADGYTEFTAGSASSVPWTGVTGKPSDYPPSSHTHTKSQITDFPTLATVATSGSYNDLNNIPASFTPSSHTHGNLTNDGKLDTASRALVTDANKNIVVSSVTATELGYVSGVTSAIQTQIAGKAPAVHTHTKVDITDFPAYGNTAGTICEGNDSRLSDARTPVAHTHTKSDVTDLFNSANMWSGDNTYTTTIKYQTSYTLGNPPQSADAQSAVMITDSAGTNYLAQIATYQDTTLSGLRFIIRDKFDSNGFSPSGSNRNKHLYFLQGTSNRGYLQWEGFVNNSLIPLISDTYNLGTLSYQWNNICAKNYYYNGVAWGLDKANTWLANNQFAKINTIETNTVEWHNSHYRGINLISDGHFADMAALLTAIRAQDWSDIYIGDYVELTFTYEGASRTVKFYVGEIDKFYNVGNPNKLTTHHLVMITGDMGSIIKAMNTTATTEGGYVGSQAHTTILPALYNILNPLFNNAILTHDEWLSNAIITSQSINNLSLDDGNGAVTYICSNFPVRAGNIPNDYGAASSGTWYSCNLVLMSEIEVYGCNRNSCGAMDDLMSPNGQIAVFKHNLQLQNMNGNRNYWLRNVATANKFAYISSQGNAFSWNANGNFCVIRPRFLIG